MKRAFTLLLFGYLFLAGLILARSAGAARLELRPLPAGADRSVLAVGDEIEVEVWIDAEGQTLSGATVFLSFDHKHFALVEEDRDPQVEGFQPFGPGPFLHNGETFRNIRLPEDDPAAEAAGIQLDYSIVRADGSGSGVLATFRLRALSPTPGSSLRIDENGIRETRFFLPDGTQQPFRFVAPLDLAVRGIQVSDLPQRIVLARDQARFSLDLGQHVFDPQYGPEEIQWHITPLEPAGPSQALPSLVLEEGVLHIDPPATDSPRQRLAIAATNPDGHSFFDTLEVIVNAPPRLENLPGELLLNEDETLRFELGSHYVDPDSPADSLQWILAWHPATGAGDTDVLQSRLTGPPFALEVVPGADWHGRGTISLSLRDEFGFADSTRVALQVLPINDGPRPLFAPNIRLTRLKADSSLSVGALFSDPDHSSEELDLSWDAPPHLQFELRNSTLVLRSTDAWTGTQEIRLRAIDPEGLSAETPLTVTVEASLPPQLLAPPARLALVAGEEYAFELAPLAVDPDDDDGSLVWSMQGHSALEVRLENRNALLRAPPTFTGGETLTFSVSDPSGETASFTVFVFAAPADGRPQLTPLPILDVPLDGVFSGLRLDDFVFDRDHNPDQIQWKIESAPGVEFRLDPETRTLSAVPSAAAVPGEVQATIEAVDPAGNRAFGVLTIRLLGAPATVPAAPPPPDPTTPPAQAPTLRLTQAPRLDLTAGQFDRSLDLDALVLEVDPGSVTWEVVSERQTRLLVDHESRRLVALPPTDWHGDESVLLRASAPDGSSAELELHLRVQQARLGPQLQATIEKEIFAGSYSFRLNPELLLGEGTDATSLAWEAGGADSLRVGLDEAGFLVVESPTPWHADALLSLKAYDTEGNPGQTNLLLHVRPNDGSYGAESPQFSLVVIPNPLQADFIDIFVHSRDDLETPPRLRLRGATWMDLEVRSSGTGTWFGRHVLAHDQEGDLRLVALGQGSQLHKSEFAFTQNSVPAAGKRIAAPDWDIEMDAGAFDGPAVVALLPTAVPPATDELQAVSPAYLLHATRPWRPQRSRIRFDASDRTGLYRWDPATARWDYLAAASNGAPLVGGGVYALMRDNTPPRLEMSTTDDSVLYLRWRDDGSGLGSARINNLPPEAYTWDGATLSVKLDAGRARPQALELVVTDRQGNQTRLRHPVPPLRPRTVFLAPNFPNPFNPSTTLPFGLETAGAVDLAVFGSTGQRVRTLHRGPLPPGNYQVSWDARDEGGQAVASGIYIYRLQVGDRILTRKMSLVR